MPHAIGQTTHAITIDAAPERVWPWFVQMGYHRAGWYTYPWVDRYLWRIDNSSAAQLIPELQDLSVDDIVPDGDPVRRSIASRSWTRLTHSCCTPRRTSPRRSAEG